MESVTLATAKRPGGDILIYINLSLFSDDIINSVKQTICTYSKLDNAVLSYQNNNNITIYFSDEMILKIMYRHLVKDCISCFEITNPPQIQETLDKKPPVTLDNTFLSSLCIKCNDKTCCNLILPLDKFFIKTILADIILSLELCGNIQIPFPDFNSDKIIVNFFELDEALRLEELIAFKLL